MVASQEMFWYAPMMRSRHKVFVFFIYLLMSAELTVFAADSKPTLKSVKDLIGRRKISDASMMLERHYKELIKSQAQRLEVNKWFSIFITDEALGYFEKAVEKLEIENEAATDLLEKANLIEPFHREISTFLIARLFFYKEARAREILQTKIKQQPYLAIFNLYQTHFQLLAQESPATVSLVPTCEPQIYQTNELDYCHLLQMIWWVKQTPKGRSNGMQAAKVIKNYSQKIKNPEAAYWLWQWSGKKEDLKSYLSKCQGLSTKDKKAYGSIPGVCRQQAQALEQLNAAEE